MADPNIFIGMFFYPLVDFLFSHFERYCQKTKKRFELRYHVKTFLVAGGWIVIAFTGLMIVGCWKRYWYFVDFNAFFDDEENDAKFGAYLIIFCIPVAVWIVYETGIFDDLTDLARSSPMEFSIVFSSGPILFSSGAFKILSSIFVGFDWIYYFVFLFAFVFYSMVGATAADQNYERDDDKRDEFELDEIGTGYYRMEGLDGMVMGIEGDKYFFAYSVSDNFAFRTRCSDRIVRLDQLPQWILEALAEWITKRIFMEVVGECTFDPELEIDKFFYFSVPPPYVPDSEHYKTEEGMLVIQKYPTWKEIIKYLPPDHPLAIFVRHCSQVAKLNHNFYEETKKNLESEIYDRLN